MAFRPISSQDAEKLNEILFRMHQKLLPAEWSCTLETGSELSDKEIFELLMEDVDAMHRIMSRYHIPQPKE